MIYFNAFWNYERSMTSSGASKVLNPKIFGFWIFSIFFEIRFWEVKCPRINNPTRMSKVAICTLWTPSFRLSGQVWIAISKLLYHLCHLAFISFVLLPNAIIRPKKTSNKSSSNHNHITIMPQPESRWHAISESDITAKRKSEQ